MAPKLRANWAVVATAVAATLLAPVTGLAADHANTTYERYVQLRQSNPEEAKASLARALRASFAKHSDRCAVEIRGTRETLMSLAGLLRSVAVNPSVRAAENLNGTNTLEAGSDAILGRTLANPAARAAVCPITTQAQASVEDRTNTRVAALSTPTPTN